METDSNTKRTFVPGAARPSDSTGAGASDELSRFETPARSRSAWEDDSINPDVDPEEVSRFEAPPVGRDEPADRLDQPELDFDLDPEPDSDTLPEELVSRLVAELVDELSEDGVTRIEDVRAHDRPTAGVPAELSAILARCLASDPGDRYPDTARLAEDLRRFLAGQTPQASDASRRRRWFGGGFGIGRLWTIVLAGVAIAAVGLIVHADARHRLQNAGTLMADGRVRIQRGEYGAAEVGLTQAIALIDGGWSLALDPSISRGTALHRALEALLDRAHRDRLADQIHTMADQLRALHGTVMPATARLRTVERQLGRTWETRNRILKRLDGPMEPGRADRLRNDLLDLGILWAGLRVKVAMSDGADRVSVHRQALRILDQAEQLLGESPVLARERCVYARALGPDELARAEARFRDAPAPRNAWEHYAVGRSLLASGNLDAAAGQLDRAAELHPDDPWIQLSRGLCAYRRHRYEDALAAFEACVTLAPETAACYHNRALAHAALGHDAMARRDRNHALRLSAAALSPDVAFSASRSSMVRRGIPADTAREPRNHTE